MYAPTVVPSQRQVYWSAKIVRKDTRAGVHLGKLTSGMSRLINWCGSQFIPEEKTGYIRDKAFQRFLGTTAPTLRSLSTWRKDRSISPTVKVSLKPDPDWPALCAVAATKTTTATTTTVFREHALSGGKTPVVRTGSCENMFVRDQVCMHALQAPSQHLPLPRASKLRQA